MKPKWTDRLPSGVYERLRNCANTKDDIPIMVNVKWAHMKWQGMESKGYVKEDALVQVLELLDENGQFFDITQDEYNELK